MAEKREKYYKDKKTWRDHEQMMAISNFLTESMKADPEFKYFMGAAGGFAVASVSEIVQTLSDMNSEERKKNTADAFAAYNVLLKGGDIATLAGLSFGGFCMLILLLKNLDGMAKLAAAAGGIVEGIVPW